MNKDIILNKLQEIVGSEFASNKIEDLFIYSQDPGASIPRHVDFIVMPKSVKEIQEIMRFANKNQVNLIPMGGGLTLSGLTIPVKGGIVVDMKRMDRIIDINETSRYALIEAGVTSGRLKAYLEENYPHLQASIPDAPPSVTLAGNALIHGSGFLSHKYGNHGDMINGLEVILPNGELCRFGSCAVSEYWFTRGPIPDLIGLFTSSFGTMGIATKLSIKLYPKPKIRDLIVGMLDDINMIPNLISKLTSSELVEDILLAIQDKPNWMKGYVFILGFINANSEDELNSKTKSLKKIYHDAKGRYMKIPSEMKNFFLEKPIFYATTSDFRKGGGFEYVGAMMPLEKIPQTITMGASISSKHGIIPTMGCRVIGKGHNILFFISYAFNRADPKDLQNARNALKETNNAVLELDGIPWKAELHAQKVIVEKMDPIYKKLFKAIRDALDPNGIMNPGNWEII